MSSALLDSQPVFKARLDQMGIDQQVVTAFMASNLTTMAKMAFSSSDQPGVGNDDRFIAAIVAALRLQRPDQLDPADLSGFRRLWYEAHSVCLADFKTRMERTDDSAPRKLPVPKCRRNSPVSRGGYQELISRAYLFPQIRGLNSARP